MSTTTTLFIAVAVLFGVGLVVLLRSGGSSQERVLDRASMGRIQRRLATIRGPDRLPASSPVPTGTMVARAPAASEVRRQLWRDASAILMLLGVLSVVLLAETSIGPTGAVLDAAATPHPRNVEASPSLGTRAVEILAPSPSPTPIAEPSNALALRTEPPATAPSPTTTAPATTPTLPGRGTPQPRDTGDRMAVLTACPDRSGCYVYVVRRGDNLVSIANWFGIPYQEVLARNPQILDPSRLHAGDHIQLPGPRR
jgi:hypothetical protein